MAAVGIMGMAIFEQQVETLSDVNDRSGPAPSVEVPGVEGFEQQLLDLAGRAPGPGGAGPRSSRGIS